MKSSLIGRRYFIRQSVLFLGGIAAGSRPLWAGWKEVDPLPALTAFGLEGTVPNIKGKVVYLDFWASWCAPCKASFPVLNRWQQQFGQKGFIVLGVSVDESVADMHRFLEKTPASFPIVRDASHKLVSVAAVNSMPTSFLVDRKGIIRHVHNGFREKDEAALVAQITGLLAQG
jgi:thiol-disulfide isomerase/thioredoxin